MDSYIPQSPSGMTPRSFPASSGSQNCLSSFPPAMAYVPMQQWQQTYDLGLALSRGTIFPELDLPFVMGRCQ